MVLPSFPREGPYVQGETQQGPAPEGTPEQRAQQAREAEHEQWPAGWWSRFRRRVLRRG